MKPEVVMRRRKFGRGLKIEAVELVGERGCQFRRKTDDRSIDRSLAAKGSPCDALPVKLAAGKGEVGVELSKGVGGQMLLTEAVRCCTVAVGETGMVDLILRKGAEEARNQLPDLLEAAEKGRSTIITRHGRPVAALVPIEAYGAAIRQQPLMPVAGSGRGLWGKNSTRTLRQLRDEWSR
jgi:prevent-host-death family protein